MNKWIKLGLALVLTPLAMALLLAAGFYVWTLIWPHRVYEIPDGYRGWVVIEYDNPQCPASFRGRDLVVTISPSGQACTSDTQLQGWRIVEFVYIRADGTRTPISREDREEGVRIRAHASQAYNTKVGNQFEIFFVGTSEELQERSNELPRLLPRPS